MKKQCIIVGLGRYGTTENMDQTVPITTESEKISKQNNVSVRLKNLIASNTYYYMLQGSNGRTITSGNMMNFTTLPNEKPKVGNTTLLSHGPTSAFVSYDILEDGGENITETGCYYELASQSATETQSEKENMEKEIPGKNANEASIPLQSYECGFLRGIATVSLGGGQSQIMPQMLRTDNSVVKQSIA